MSGIDEDEAWVMERSAEMRAIGVVLRLYEMKVFSNPVSVNWNCEAIINGTVYCCEVGATRREVVGMAIATVMAARLQGLKLRDDARPTPWGG